ncbi:pyruvate, phosphate dikinase [Alicyclobacillus hesperidum]|uniref:Pyruvate, phosphate dikinase n=1 Tax=Alicyclobacillus hesperidum TaxID=89784 RepID=A0A1H2SSG4_9BACL|nr:pyruvate, phosphate dikinase [Alicyclobacillus hesperidum]GLV12535.1 pyruvate, phosphate dikinase [Alicyclobacillus hesperidum]SDW34603.1 pyruvate phosphate dikinase [Alicyclobacillus hesperidum]
MERIDDVTIEGQQARSVWVYAFDQADPRDRTRLGGKGANLAQMVQWGLPVPPGFTITTEACKAFWQAGERLPDHLQSEVSMAMLRLERAAGKRFGDAFHPLLVSVRSGAPVSMPGMMDTILNLGLNDVTVRALAYQSQNPAFAYDSYRRLIQMFANVVFHVPLDPFEHVLQSAKARHGCKFDGDLAAGAWKEVVATCLRVYAERVGEPFPQDVHTQLRLAIEAVFRSWRSQRAMVYRKLHNLSEDLGTAVNVQAMVFGNIGEDSGTGVIFTRHPATGERALFGEFLVNAQGEEVVAGTRTPQPIAELAIKMPTVYRSLITVAHQLETRFRDMQDVEFTVERGRLYVLQTRNGKRTAQAAVKIAIDMVHEGLIQPQEALLRVDAQHLRQLLYRRLQSTDGLAVLTKGLPASPGAAVGRIVFDANTAVAWAGRGERVILVRPETTPEDIHGVLAAEGVVTLHGGMTSHAAVVARGIGKPAVCGCDDLRIDMEKLTLCAGEAMLREGDWVSVDGGMGMVFIGQGTLAEAQMANELNELLAIADQVRRLRVRANADTPEDARRAREFGAEGIGLCRTEHMFLSPARVPLVQRMILATHAVERKAALDELLPLQVADFTEIFRVMDGLPVTIRLLDPPLHEFLPREEELVANLGRLRAKATSESEIAEVEQLLCQARYLREANPMMGLRGSRLGIVYPEIYDMQMEAIVIAAAQAVESGIQVELEVMLPLIGSTKELRHLRERMEQVGQAVMERLGVTIDFRIGTMIEVPRAALTADEIAEDASFFSFGTNDLTQMTYAFSRDDAEGKFLNVYFDRDILSSNPFETLDTRGVGRLIRWAVESGKSRRPDLKTGVCGEHGGDPASIAFCEELGLDYVSCSPFRIPVARIAAAQAALQHERIG